MALKAAEIWRRQRKRPDEERWQRNKIIVEGSMGIEGRWHSLILGKFSVERTIEFKTLENSLNRPAAI